MRDGRERREQGLAGTRRLEYGFVGEVYEFVIRRPVLSVADLLHRIDSLAVDSAFLGLGRSTQAFSRILRTTESGHAQHYGLIMAAGILALWALARLAL